MITLRNTLPPLLPDTYTISCVSTIIPASGVDPMASAAEMNAKLEMTLDILGADNVPYLVLRIGPVIQVFVLLAHHRAAYNLLAHLQSPAV